MRQTMKYTHIGLADQAQALAGLPAPFWISHPCWVALWLHFGRRCAQELSAGDTATSMDAMPAGGVPEVVVAIKSPDARLGDARLPHPPAGMEFEPVIPALGKLDRMVRRVGRNAFRLGKQTYRLNRRNDGSGWLLSELRCSSPGRVRDAVEELLETPSCVHARLISSDARCHAPGNSESRFFSPRQSDRPPVEQGGIRQERRS